MRFEFFHSGLENVPKLSVDGTVGNSIHFSHWQGNETPAPLKADTSTEIALNLVASPDATIHTRGIDLVTNNHFDTDGVLSVWTVLTGKKALDFKDKLIPAAEAGDFSEYSSEQGVKASIVIQGSDQANSDNDQGSPLARHLAGHAIDDDAQAYALVLPEIEGLMTDINRYEPLWLEAWRRVVAAIESFEKGRSQVKEFSEAQLSLVTLAPEVFSQAGFNPTRHAPPYTAISRFARGQLFLVTTPVKDGFIYRIDYPYYSWAETVKRPQIKHRDLGPILTQLNETEQNRSGKWQIDTREMTSAAKFLNQDGSLGASTIQPDDVARVFSRQFAAPQLSARGTT